MAWLLGSNNPREKGGFFFRSGADNSFQLYGASFESPIPSLISVYPTFAKGFLGEGDIALWHRGGGEGTIESFGLGKGVFCACFYERSL